MSPMSIAMLMMMSMTKITALTLIIIPWNLIQSRGTLRGMVFDSPKGQLAVRNTTTFGLKRCKTSSKVRWSQTDQPIGSIPGWPKPDTDRKNQPSANMPIKFMKCQSNLIYDMTVMTNL